MKLFKRKPKPVTDKVICDWCSKPKEGEKTGICNNCGKLGKVELRIITIPKGNPKPSESMITMATVNGVKLVMEE